MAREEAERLAEQLEQKTLELSASAEKRNRSEATIESLNEKLVDASSRREYPASRDRQLNSMTGQLVQLQSTNEEQAKLAENRIADLTAQLERLEKDKQSSEEKLLQAQTDAAKASSTLADRDQLIRSQNEDWNDQKIQLKQQLDSQSQSLTQLNAALSSSKQTQSEIVQLKAKLDQQNVRFESEVSDLKISHDRELQKNARTSGADLHSVRIELEHYQRQVAEFTTQLAKSKERKLESEQKREQAETRLKEAQTEMDRLAQRHNEQLVSLKQSAEQEQVLRTREASDLQQQLQASKELHAIELRKLKANLSSKKAELTASPPRPLKPKRKPASSRKPKTSKLKNSSDDLTKISGIGPVAAKNLHKLGVKSFQQISNWTAKDVQEFSEALSVGGRVKSEQWVRQAKKLAR